MKKVGECIKEWMEKYKRTSVKAATYDRLETSYQLMCKYQVAYIGYLELTSEDIQNYLNRLVQDGYALTTIKKQYNLLSGYIRWANAEGIMPRAIYNNVSLPSRNTVKKPKKEMQVYNKMQQMTLRKELQTNKRGGYPVALLMLETGIRVGEAIALAWDDVDWDRRSLRINKTMVRLGNRKKMFVQNSAKTITSERTIPLSKIAYETLENLYMSARKGQVYIFEENEKPFSYEKMRWDITIACNEANVPYMGQHVFRHTFATNCYYKGCNVKILSKLLGHSNPTVTYNTYIHLFGDELEEMRSVVG